jgi:hypothetical protein
MRSSCQPLGVGGAVGLSCVHIHLCEQHRREPTSWALGEVLSLRSMGSSAVGRHVG